jgi:hypothetical protein
MPLECEGRVLQLAVTIVAVIHVVKYLIVELTGLWLLVRKMKTYAS